MIAMGDAQHAPGRWIVRLNLALTVVFIITASYAAIVFDVAAQWVGAGTAMTLFAIGVAAFIWAFWNAVQRSRTDEISVTQLFLLAGSPTPAVVRRPMVTALVLQILVAAATAVARPNSPNGSPGSSLAVGVLVPMLGVGLNGLWAALHGRFAERRTSDD